MTACNCKKGFTLIELLVAMAISGIVITAIYATYQSQQESYLAQEEVAAMQQKIRAAMYYMTRQIQEAGCNPCRTANAGIIIAELNKLQFTADVRGAKNPNPPPRYLGPDGNTNDDYEDITYSLVTSGGIQSLCVTTPAVNNNQPEPVAPHVNALDFVYLDQNGNVLNDDGNGNVTTSINDIRSVEVTLVVRAEREDRDYTNDTAYQNKQGDVILPAQNDHYRRRSSIVRIKCRNLGL